MLPEKPTTERLGDPDEPEALRFLTKKDIHARLSEEWFLPDKNCRGVTRQYLIGVYRDTYFRLGLFDMQRFLAELNKDALKRVPYENSADIKAKVEVQLAEQGFRPLGYAPHIIPEEDWLVKVARYLDQTNNCAIFLHALDGGVTPNTVTQQMKRAKTNCQTFLLGNLRSNRDVVEDIEHLWQAQKRFVNRMREVAALQAHLAESNAKLAQLGNQVNASLLRAATTVYKAGTEDNNPESIFLENQTGQNVRLQVNHIQRL